MIDYDSYFSRAGLAMRESAIRRMGTVLADARDMVSFAPGYPTESTFPWDAFRSIADDLLRGRQGSVLQYGATRGYRPLLESVATIMKARGIRTSDDHLAVTNGSQQGLDLVARVLFNPGDVVLMELPSYTGAITAFRNVGVDLVGVNQDVDGLNLDALDSTLSRLRAEGRTVKCLYVVPNFQNPTGLLVSLTKRTQLLEWAARREVLIIEDDPYRDLFFEDVAQEFETRAIAADDHEGRVVYLSSFSKTLAPGLRVAWIHAAPELIAKFEMAKQASDLCTGGLAQQMVDESIRRGVLAQQLPQLRAHYQAQRDVMVEALQAAFGTGLTWEQPRGGFFLWAALGDGLDGDAVLPFAQARGVIYVAGSAFFVNGNERRFLRLSFSSPSPDRIREGVARLALAVTDASQSVAASAAPASR